MKRLFRKPILLVLFVPILLLVSCVSEDDSTNTPVNNFEALWKLMDEHYCFFEYKQKELGVSWKEVHGRYRKMVNDDMTSKQLFEVLTRMLSELKDGHVNLGTSFDYGRNWSFYEDYPLNLNDSIVSATYLGHDYSIASGLNYRILDDNVAYVQCKSFNAGIGSGNVSMMLQELAVCNGIILDIRGNGGGSLETANVLASHFTNEKILVGYVSHKTGTGHSDFSTPVPEYLEPASKGIRWQKPVIVLTNREVFSAANDFVKNMRLCSNVTILGDRTGGGSGMPFHSELPNGWSVRYSAVVTYDKDMKHTEFGIDPDVFCFLSGEDTSRHKDTLIEKAREMLRQ